MGRAATSLNTTCVGSAVSDGTQYAARLGKMKQSRAALGASSSSSSVVQESQVGAAPMILKHDLGVHTEEPATLGSPACSLHC